METAVRFDSVSFAYPKREYGVVDDRVVEVRDKTESTVVFRDVSVELPASMMAVVGQNGIGKSTLLLLAGGRLFPQEGSVQVLGRRTAEFLDAAIDPEVETERNRYASFVYQNMEFETKEPVGELMEAVYADGFWPEKDPGFLSETRDALELDQIMGKRTQELSKGQLQRAIIGFSLLYGSKMIIMDEPVFALEEQQKERVFEYLLHVSRSRSVPIYYSVHNFELSQKYSSTMVLFAKSGDFVVGPTEEVCARDRIEAAYEIPMQMLHRREHLYREMLIKSHAGATPSSQ